MPNLPTNIDSTYSDDPGDPSVKAHQQAHDQLHGYVNTHNTALDPHGDRAWASGQFPTKAEAAADRGSDSATTSFGADTSVPTSTQTLIPFTAGGAWWSSATPTRLTVPAGLGGVFIIRGRVRWNGAATGTRSARLLRNGVQVEESVCAAATVPHAIDLLSRPIALAAGDYVELAAWQDSGAAVTVLGAPDWTNLSLIRLGA